MVESVREVVADRGFALLLGFAPGKSAEETAESLGVVFSLSGHSRSQPLTPRERADSTPNTYSGNYGLGDFPLHTDLAHWAVPPRYLLLRCVRGVEGVATRLLDGRQVAGTVGEAALSRALVQPRRLIERSRPLLRLLDRRGDTGQFLRWDRMFLVPATPASGVTFRAVRDCVESSGEVAVSLENPGDTLVIDNWRMLHGRSPVAPGQEGRRIDRVYLDNLH